VGIVPLPQTIEALMSSDFSAKADEMVARIQATAISPDTRVDLIYYCVDGGGVFIKPFRVPISIAPATLEGMSDAAMVERKRTVIDNVNVLVRPESGELKRFLDGPNYDVRVVDIELDVH
jgi:hypothetical protein